MPGQFITLRRTIAGLMLLMGVSWIALSGCAIVVSHYNGHWEYTRDVDGRIISKVCVPGGSECTVAGVDVKRSVF